MKIKYKELKGIREELLINQKHKCFLCQKEYNPEEPKDWHVHHNHETGFIICVLCRRCNVQESKWLNGYRRNTKKELKSEDDFMFITKNLYKLYTKKPTKYIHPTFKTPEEKKELAKKRAKKRRNKK